MVCSAAAGEANAPELHLQSHLQLLDCAATVSVQKDGKREHVIRSAVVLLQGQSGLRAKIR